MSFRRRALASEATFLTPAHQPKTEKNRERKRQRANRAGVGEKSQRRVADYPLHRLSNQPVFQTEIPPTASVQRTDRAKKKALCNGDSLVTSALAPEGVQNPYPSPLLDPSRRFTYEEDRYPTAHRRRGDIRPLRVLNSSLLRKQAPALRHVIELD